MHPEFMKDMIKTSGDIWAKGWAERNAGNISIRINSDELGNKSMLHTGGPWIKLHRPIGNLGGEYFLVTGTGRYIRNIPLDQESNTGIIELDPSGESYRHVWGYKNGSRPTSELYAHLEAHSVRKEVSGGSDRAIIHTHPTNIVALTYALELDTVSITKLLWEMHAECITVYPEGIEYLPWMMAGSEEIAKATAEAFVRRSMVVWEYHGVFASGRNLDVAFGIIDTAEKAAEIYLKAMQTGGVKKSLNIHQLVAIARNFGFEPAGDIVGELMKGK